MNKVKRAVRRLVGPALAAGVVLAVPPYAWAGGAASGGSTEFTQIMNNAELVWSNKQNAEQLLTEINQYTAMLQNLERLPTTLVDKITSVYGGDVANRIQQLQSAATIVMQAKDSSERLATALQNTAGAAERMKMTPYEYANLAIQRATSNSNYYRAQLDEANRAAADVKENSRKIDAVATTIGSGAETGNAGMVKAVENMTRSSVIAAQIANDTQESISKMKTMQAMEANARVQDKAADEAFIQQRIKAVNGALGR